MHDSRQITVFALDCGATNWRLYRVEYRMDHGCVRMLGEPQPSPLTSFIDRRLPAIISLNPAGNSLDCFGETAQQQLDDERFRERIREHFKPCIGAHLEENPLPHQKRYTHNQALQYTQFLLQAILDQIRYEKLRSADFDDRVVFSFAYPVHWRTDHDGQIYTEFSDMVRSCFPDTFEGLRFVAEPEGAIHSLKAHGLLNPIEGGKATLIIDVGGSTTDIIAGRVDSRNGELRFLGRFGGSFGGDLYDAELAKVIADQLKLPASALADDPPALISLRFSALRLKESLSRQLLYTNKVSYVPQRTVTLVMQNGNVYRRVVAIDEEQFRTITNNLDLGFASLIDNALQSMAIQESAIGQVVLVGGGSQLFTIIAYLRERFGKDRVLLADTPEEIVAQGLGLEYGASLEKREPTIQFPAIAADQPLKSVAQPNLSRWKLMRGDSKPVDICLGVTTIGRGEENGLQIRDIKVSRLHAELHATSENLILVDLNSTNGTFVNGERLPANQPVEIKPNDELRFGNTRFICQD
jgi:molecular chaperone DnaK (HSP70)